MDSPLSLCSTASPRSPASTRLTTTAGLGTLEQLKKQVDLDQRRCGASIALNKSMETWVARKSPKSATNVPPKLKLLDESPHAGRVSISQICGIECVANLEQAFQLHCAAFDLDGDGTIDVEELIVILDRSKLFDQKFTPDKVRKYFTTWTDGCNAIHGFGDAVEDNGVGFFEFQKVLQWAADLKGIDFEECVLRVVRLSRKLCDKAASVQKRLEVVFDSFCKREAHRMSAYEFGQLCMKIEIPICMGDIFLLFGHYPGGMDKGVDFMNFMSVLEEVGKRIGIGDEVYPIVAKAVELLDTDEETIIRVKMRLRHAANIVGGTDWEQFFRDCDDDSSGTIDWDEFLAICRDKLHLADRDNHLRLLFEKLDDDASGELEIEELIAFIGDVKLGPTIH